jgi:hypothetical protein
MAASCDDIQLNKYKSSGSLEVLSKKKRIPKHHYNKKDF